jgi:hypothetical protein
VPWAPTSAQQDVVDTLANSFEMNTAGLIARFIAERQ